MLSEKTHRNEFKKIVQTDPALLDEYGVKDFKYVIDIGAHIGMFTTMARIRFPYAKIVSYEPCPKTFSSLKENCSGFYDTTLYNLALGDGSILKLLEGSRDLDQMFVKDDGSDGVFIETIKFDQIINDIDLDDDVLLKVDCEGGEEVFLSGEYDDLIRKCKHIAFEVHFKGSKVGIRNQYFREWKEYNNWIRGFESSHKITYHISNRHRGYGHYVLKKK